MQLPDMQTHDYYDYWKPVIAGTQAPDEWQQAMMDVVQQALAAGIFYNTDMDAYVKQHGTFIPPEFWGIQFKNNSVEGGKIGMEIYEARKAIEERDSRAENIASVSAMKVGQQIGSVIASGKQVHKCVVKAIDGYQITMTGVIGKYQCEVKAEARHVKVMQERYQQLKRLTKRKS